MPTDTLMLRKHFKIVFHTKQLVTLIKNILKILFHTKQSITQFTNTLKSLSGPWLTHEMMNKRMEKAMPSVSLSSAASDGAFVFLLDFPNELIAAFWFIT